MTFWYFEKCQILLYCLHWPLKIKRNKYLLTPKYFAAFALGLQSQEDIFLIISSWTLFSFSCSNRRFSRFTFFFSWTRSRFSRSTSLCAISDIGTGKPFPLHPFIETTTKARTTNKDSKRSMTYRSCRDKPVQQNELTFDLHVWSTDW